MPGPLELEFELYNRLLNEEKVDPSQQDAIATAHQATLPEWKQKAISLLEKGGDFISGFLMGDPLDPNASKANLSGQLLQSGLPLGLGATGIKGLYSRLGKAAEALPQTDTATAVKKFLTRRAGKEEMDWRSLGTLLKDKTPTERVSPQEVQDYLAKNPLKLKTTTLGEPKDLPRKPAIKVHQGWAVDLGDRRTVRVQQDQAGRFHAETGRTEWTTPSHLVSDSIEDITRQIYDAKSAEPYIPTKYSNYTLPGGKNYRETLIQLDKSHKLPTPEELAEFHYKHYGTKADPMFMGQDEAQGRDTLRSYLEANDPPFRSSHWDEKDILAHVRHNEREIPIGKPTFKVETGPDAPIPNERQRSWGTFPDLESANQSGAMQGVEGARVREVPTSAKGRFIEEIQSDWHEQGRDRGYLLPQTEQDRLIEEAHKKYGAAEAARLDYVHAHPEVIGANLGDHPELDSLWETRVLRETDLNNLRNKLKEGVPDAPFKQDWPNLALKQQLMEVVDDPNLEWMGWTPGKVQNDRYDLSEQVSRLAFDQQADGTGSFHAWDKHGNQVVQKDLKSPEELVDLIGKDAAQRLMNNKVDPSTASYSPPGGNSFELMGEDLSIGGQGMTDFYDRQLPDRLNKILGPFGGKVEQADLPVGMQFKHGVATTTIDQVPAPVKAWIARLSPEMKAQIKEKGLPLLMLLLAREMEGQNANNPN